VRLPLVQKAQEHIRVHSIGVRQITATEITGKSCKVSQNDLAE